MSHFTQTLKWFSTTTCNRIRVYIAKCSSQLILFKQEQWCKKDTHVRGNTSFPRVLWLYKQLKQRVRKHTVCDIAGFTLNNITYTRNIGILLLNKLILARKYVTKGRNNICEPTRIFILFINLFIFFIYLSIYLFVNLDTFQIVVQVTTKA